MRFSLRNLGVFIAWSAMIAGLICQLRFEASNGGFASNAVADVLWIVNLLFALMSILIAVSTSARRRFFWIGCAIVATALFLLQATGQQPQSLARMAALPLTSIIFPDAYLQRLSRAAKETHLMQLGSILIYGLTPWLSLAGGTLAQRIHEKAKE